MVSEGEKIRGFVCGENVLVWSSEEVERLNNSWRILGNLIGAHPGKPHQNAIHSLPLLLLPQEVALLQELNILELYDPGHADKEDKHPASVFSGNQDLLEVREDTSQACTQSAGRYSSSELTRTSQRLTNLAATSGLHQLKYKVFRDLWRHGYYLTSGLKFGGDFLIYEAHPNLTHATYIAVVLPWEQSMGNRVGGLSRVAAQVRKKILLCSERDGTVTYFTLEWTKLH